MYSVGHLTMINFSIYGLRQYTTERQYSQLGILWPIGDIKFPLGDNIPNQSQVKQSHRQIHNFQLERLILLEN